MASLPARLDQAKRAGCRVLEHFDMGSEAMATYHKPHAARVDDMAASLAGA